MAKLVTDIGNQKLLVATPLQPVTIKSIAIGSGTGSFDSSIMALKTEVWRGDATAPIKNSDGELEISAIIPANVGGWTMTEWGWFDIEGDLIAYGQFDNTIYKSVGTMTIQPDLALALTGSVEADIIVTDSLNWEHNKMTGRNAADAHPISSITGLQTALDTQKIHSNLTGRNVADSHPTSAITGLDAFMTRENQNRNSKTITDDYTVTATDGGSFLVDASSKNIKITMAVASTATSIEYNFLRTDSSTNTVEIVPNGSDIFWGEGFNWPKAIMRQGEPFIFKKINSTTWSGVRGTRFQISATEDGKPIIVNNGVSSGQMTLLSEFDSTQAAIGYTRMPNGMMMQWGFIDYPSNPGEVPVDIVFPVPFKENCFNVSLTRKAIDGVAADGIVNLISKTRTGFRAHFNTWDTGGTSGLRGFEWFAIGN